MAHASYCQDLGGALHDHVAVTYGVTRDSILNTSRYFHVIDGLVPDIMHDILEGAVQLNINLLLLELKSRELLNLKVLNSRIASFCYGPVDAVNKPTPLPENALVSSDTSLKQSGILLVQLYQEGLLK